MYRICLIVTIFTLSACSTLQDQSNEHELYQAARSQLEEGNYNSAETQYLSIEERFPFGDYSRQIQLERMYANLMQGKSDEVIYAAARFIRLNPDHEQIDYVYYMRAMAKYNKIGKGGFFSPEPEEKSLEPLSGAFASFQQLTDQFPNSQYNELAKTYMLDIRGDIALYHLTVANWYVKKEAWVAVASRAETILTEIPGSRYSKEAASLAIMAYKKMGNNDKAAEFERYLGSL